jgi:hypothetical protein
MNAPLLEALAQFHRRDRYSHTPPGDRQGTGAGARTLPAPCSALTPSSRWDFRGNGGKDPSPVDRRHQMTVKASLSVNSGPRGACRLRPGIITMSRPS